MLSKELVLGSFFITCHLFFAFCHETKGVVSVLTASRDDDCLSKFV